MTDLAIVWFIFWTELDSPRWVLYERWKGIYWICENLSESKGGYVGVFWVDLLLVVGSVVIFDS